MKIIKSRLFKLLVIAFIIGVILGIISYFIIDNKNSLINYFSIIKNGDFNYFKSFLISLSYNIKFSLLIWIFGIIFIFAFTIPIIIVFRGISIGLVLCGIICSFKIKGLIIALILLIPCTLLNELIMILISYYSINYSLKSLNAFKNNKLINLKTFSINYIYIFLTLSLVLVFSSFFETYISSNIIKFVL